MLIHGMQYLNKKAIQITDTAALAVYLRLLATQIYGDEAEAIHEEKDLLVNLLEESAQRLHSEKRVTVYRQDAFLEICPNAPRKDGTINICPKKVDRNYKSLCVSNGKECSKCKQDYWFEKVTK